MIVAMRRKTYVVKSVFGGWAIVYYLDNGFPIPCDRVLYQFKWMAQLRKWWVEEVCGNPIDY